MNKGVLHRKRGQTAVAGIVVGVIALIYVVSFFVVAYQNNWDWGTATDRIGSFNTAVLGPLFSTLLNLKSEGADNFLMILTFILLTIIVTGTMDSIEIFSGTSGNRWLNLAIGLIVSIIGVRYMPSDVWGSLTAPSSALVATVLFGIPFLALFFISMKAKYSFIAKAFWIFYMIFLTYLIIKGSTGGFIAVYFTFLVLSGIMLFFDGTIRSWFYKEKAAVQMADMIGNLNVKQRYKLRKEIEDYNNVIADPNAPQADIDKAKKKLTALEKQYGDLSVI